MNQTNYLTIVRRRWYLVFLLVVVGGLVAVLVPVTSTSRAGSGGPLAPRFSAVATVAVDPSSQSSGNTSSVDPAQLIGAFHSPTVEGAVASALGHEADAVQIGKAVTLTPTGSSTGEIQGSARTAAEAVLLTNTYTSAVLSYVARANDAASRSAAAAASAHATKFRALLSSIGAKLAPLQAAEPTAQSRAEILVLQAQAQSLQSAYESAYGQYLELSASEGLGSGLEVVQTASAATVSRLSSSSAPSRLDERRVRGPLGALIGLLIGIVLASLLAQTDRRIRGKAGAESAFGLPVLAEVPRYRLTRSMRDVVVDAAPLSRTAEAYRALRTVVIRALPGDDPALIMTERLQSARVGGPRDAHISAMAPVLAPPARPRPRGMVIALASPEPQRVRAVVVANVAAAFAEQGRSVLVLSTVGPVTGRGGSIEATHPMEGDLSRLSHPTPIKGVRTLTLPALTTGRAERPDFLERLVVEARSEADVVLVDPAPVLTSHDAGAVAQVADVMVLVAECNWTRLADAREASEVLARLEAPVRGVLLVQADRRRLRSGRRNARTPLHLDADILAASERATMVPE